MKEADKSYDVVRQNVDKLNKELGSKMEELENKEKHLREVETRIQLSLRCGQFSFSLFLSLPAQDAPLTKSSCMYKFSQG